jgi:hypothetical protein
MERPLTIGSSDDELTIDRNGNRWVVTMGERRLEGRAITSLLETLLGVHDPRILPLTFDALDWLAALDQASAREARSRSSAVG